MYATFDGKLLHKYRGHLAPVTSVDFGYGGYKMVSGSLDGTARIYDVTNQSLTKVIGGGSMGAVNSVKLNRDNTLLFTASSDHNIRLWNISTNKVMHVFKGHTNAVTSIDL